jgi:hypothetical protein
LKDFSNFEQMLLLPVAQEGVVLLFLVFAYLTVYQVGFSPRMEQQPVLAHPVEVGLNGSQGTATGRPAPYGSAQACVQRRR